MKKKENEVIKRSNLAVRLCDNRDKTGCIIELYNLAAKRERDKLVGQFSIQYKNDEIECKNGKFYVNGKVRKQY